MQIISSRCDENTLEDAFIIVSEIEVKDDRGQSSFYTLADLDGEPAFYHSEHSLLDDLLEDERSEAFDGELKSCDMGISDYEEVFEMGASLIKEILRYLVFLVRGDADEEVAPVQPRAALLQGAVAELVDGVAGVADELPEENFPMGVDGMDHEIQQPFGFRFELSFSHC